MLRQYGVATTLYFPLIDKGATDFESTPVTIASGDCKISKDGGAFANTTTASFSHVAGGIYSIPLTATEMQARVVVVKIVDQTGTKEWEDQCIVIETTNHASAEIPSFWASVQDIVASAITASSIAADAITAAKIADGAIDAATFAAGAINAAAIAADAITAAKIADGAIDAATFAAGAINAAAIATDAITAAKIAADAIGASELAADAVTEIQSGLATAAALNTVDDFLDTEIAAIKAKTDLIPAAPAAVGDIPTAIQNADALLTRNVSNTEGSAPIPSLTSVILKLASRFKASTGQTFRTNATTVHMTQAPTTDPAADPITELGAGA